MAASDSDVLEQILTRLDGIDNRLDGIDKRLAEDIERIEGKLDRVILHHGKATQQNTRDIAALKKRWAK